MEDLTRRDFLKTAAGTAAAVAATSVMSSALASEPERTVPAFEGKYQFAGTNMVRKVTDDIYYLGASDRRIALFENVYPVSRGMAYNSYLLVDEKTVLFDTVDRSVSGQFFENLEAALNGRNLDYFVVHHMEPDHCSAMTEVLDRYPSAIILCSETAAQLMNQFFGLDIKKHGYIMEEGSTLSTGKHELTFVMAPMVHWPDVMLTYDSTDKVLFSADAFGSFGALNGNLFADQVNFETEWLADARRYYVNIVGKYGTQVQAALAKAATLDIGIVCPLHGPIWRENFAWLLDKYNSWSSYTPEDDGSVMVVYGSVYGGTENAASVIANRLSENGIRNIAVYDVSKTHVSELIAEAFRCSHIVFASITYNMGIFTPMRDLLEDLKAHNLQNRSYALVQNGSWSPASGAQMEEIIAEMSDMHKIGDTVTVLSTPNAESAEALIALADEITSSVTGETVAEPEEAAAATKSWKCNICGYIYEGDELPEGFVCPICGVDVSHFEEVV